MKMKMLFVPVVMVIMSVPSVTTFTTTTASWTTARPAVNLNGKMFTLSNNGGGISFYSNFRSSDSSYMKHWPPSTSTPWTTPLSTKGFSVCLRYLTDYLSTSGSTLLKLKPTGFYSLTLGTSSGISYSLTNDYSYRSLVLRPNIRFWSEVFAQDMWTRVCVTVDSVKKVAQVFSGSNMSIRKILPSQFVCPQCSRAHEPVIDVPGFDGQLTDVQMWDYPLDHGGIILYMRSNAYRPSRGSVLSWDDISYSVNGNSLLEDVYEAQEPQPISKAGRRRKMRRGKKSRRVFSVEENKERERELQ